MTPQSAVAGALRCLGLVPGVDFRVRTHREARGLANQQPVGVLVLTTPDADTVIADNAAFIESETAATGFPFTVRVDKTRHGTPICTVYHLF